MQKVRKITFEEYDKAISLLAQKIKASGKKYTAVYGIPRGGYYPAIQLSNILGIPAVTSLVNGVLVIDDIMDSGATLEPYTQDKAVVYCKDIEKAERGGVFFAEPFNEWLDIPDEKGCGIEDHIRRMLEYIGENPNREGLIGTPDRIVRMWKEIYRGYDPSQKPKITIFDNGKDGITYDNMVVDSGKFNSMCEHHLMPFWGKYWFAYIPNPKGKILGLSKIARVVDYCAARAQIQERLVYDIVKMLKEALDCEYPPIGMALIMKAHHGCKEFRGVKKEGLMTSSYLDGVFKEDTQVRSEFMSLVNTSKSE